MISQATAPAAVSFDPYTSAVKTGALRLLGAEAVLTGIAPEIATTLVGLGIDLSSFVTMGTLQGAMEYALHRVQRSGFTRGRARR